MSAVSTILRTLKGVVNTQGSLDIAVQDQTSDIVDYLLCVQIADLTLSADGSIDDTTISVTDGSGVVDGTYVCIQEDTRAFQAKVLSGGGTNTLTLDTPLDYAFTTSALVANRNPSLNVDGSTLR